MKFYLIFAFLFITQLSFAQKDCGCNDDLNFVIQYYEDNLPGFSDNVNDETIDHYTALKLRLQKTSLLAKNEVACYKELIQYVEYFKDNHSAIFMSAPRVNEKDKKAVQDFKEGDLYQSRETYPLIKTDYDQYPLSDIRGIYQNRDTTYTIAIIPDKNEFRDYIGVITDSRTELWKVGQVKLELKAKENGDYIAFSYQRNHSLKYHVTFPYKAGVLSDGWYKTNLLVKKNHSINNNEIFDFHLLNDSTAYLRFPSFGGGYSAVFDSIYATADSLIRATPYLIVDVRDNGGGSDRNVEPLFNYTYTNEVIGDVVDLYATDDHLKMWKSWYGYMLEDSLNFGPEILTGVKERIDTISSVQRPSFISLGKEDTLRLESLTFPRKVAILYNKYCASSCETLLFGAMQSTKTILVGENSGGYVGYGENGNVETPCFKFPLTCTMTRYNKQRKYEVIGIPPDYRLDNHKDWIQQTIDLLIAPEKDE